MNLVITILATSISLLSSTMGRSAQIISRESWDYPLHCDNYTLSLHLSISEIKRESIASPSIRCLNMSNNGIVIIEEGAFDQLPNLEYLNLQGNQIKKENLFLFGNLTNIKKLILSDNINYDWSEGSINVRGTYPQLQYLDLRNTGATSLKSEQEDPFPKLKYLDFSSNEIDGPNVINVNLVKKLTHIVLNRNKFVHVSLTKFPNLSSVGLDDNRIQVIDSHDGLDLTGLTKLNYLSVANNRINFISREAFRDTVNLQYLNIAMNNLSSLYAETLMDLKSLQVLILDHNSFDAIPAMIIPMNITTLSMKCNKVIHPKLDTSKLPYLRKLYLSGNEISIIDNCTFATQKTLEELYLNDNLLTSLPEGWYNSIKMLRVLDLSGNQFTLLDSLFQSFAPSLQFIYFERNPFEYINTSTFKIIPKNVTIYLNSNSIHSIELCKPSYTNSEAD